MDQAEDGFIPKGLPPESGEQIKAGLEREGAVSTTALMW